jgi:hypothetical protein
VIDLIEGDCPDTASTRQTRVKDGLVEHTTDWPGLDCLAAIDKDVPLVAERPRHFFRPDTSLPERETLIFVRPPGFEDLSHGQWFARVREAVTAVEQSAAAERQSLGRKALGAKAVLRQHWDDSPSSREPRRVLSPRVAAKNKWARVEALMRNKWFIDAYRAAREAFLRGIATVFPFGTYWLRRFAGVRCESDPPPGAAAA